MAEAGTIESPATGRRVVLSAVVGEWQAHSHMTSQLGEVFGSYVRVLVFIVLYSVHSIII